MHVLFLGDPENPLVEWLRKHGETVTATSDKMNIDQFRDINPDFVVSYNYTHLIRQPVLDLFPGRIINLHISYLPYNRGMHPNVWSFVERTPPGVTIHVMEAGLDTGDILVQKPVRFMKLENPKWTLASTYDKLQQEIQQLFKDNWDKLKIGGIPGKKQDHEAATFHYGKELKKVEGAMTNGWQTTIKEFIENVRGDTK